MLTAEEWSASRQLGAVKDKQNHGYVQKRTEYRKECVPGIPWTYCRRYLVIEGTESGPKLHYFNSHDPQEQIRGTLRLTNSIIEEIEEENTFRIFNKDQHEGGEPTWVLRCTTKEEMQAW